MLKWMYYCPRMSEWQARWWVKNLDASGDALPLSIMRYKGQYVLVDDGEGELDRPRTEKDIAVGPFPTLTAAKVAYILTSTARGDL